MGGPCGGFRYIWETRMIVTILVIGLLPILLGMPYMTLLPAFADQILGVGATGFGLLTSVAGVGGLSGALVVASVNFRREGMAMLVATFFFGASLVVLGAAPILVVTVPALFFIGITNSLFQAMTQTTLMRIAPEEMRGRVMGIRMLDFGLSPLGTSFAGFLAELTSLPLTLMVMGSSCALLAVGVGLVTPSLRNLSGEAASIEPEVVQGERRAPLMVER